MKINVSAYELSEDNFEKYEKIKRKPSVSREYKPVAKKKTRNRERIKHLEYI